MNTFISHGPVQINVERGTCASDIPDDCVLPRGSGRRCWSTLLKVGGALVALMIGAATVLHVAELAASAVAWFLTVAAELAASSIAWITSTFAWIVSMSTVVCTWTVRLVLGGWLVGRAAELYLLIERALGGGPWRLILFSNFFGRRAIEVQLCPQADPPEHDSPTPQLAAGKSHTLAACDTRKAFATRRQPTSSLT